MEPRRPIDPTLAHGIDAMDLEHQGQLEHMESVGAAMNAQLPPEAVAREIGALVSYLEAHFLSEQIAMREQAYPDYEAHVQEHDRAVSMLRALEARWRRGDREASADTLEALRGWLLTHIRTVDRDLAEFFRKRGNAHVD